VNLTSATTNTAAGTTGASLSEHTDLDGTSEQASPSGRLPTATPSNTVPKKRGPVAKRRFQKGCFIIDESGSMYCKHYADGPDGSTRQVKQFIGNLSRMSERAARREFARIMAGVNEKRGSVAPVPVGETFASATAKWFRAVAPNLSPSTVRPREYFLKNHIMPMLANKSLSDIGVAELQELVTAVRRKSISPRTVRHMLATIFAVTKYAEKCGAKVKKVSFSDLKIGSIERATPVPFLMGQPAVDVIAAAKGRNKTIFSIARLTGVRPGELLALNVADLDFEKKTIRINKTCDDRTREIRQPKTKASIALLPMPSALESVLREYMLGWVPNERGLLFATKDGRPLSRDKVVRDGLKPILRKLGLPVKDCGLHAFRHGLATELAEASVPLTVLQKQLRHADIQTTLRTYAHAIPQTQRDAMEMVSLNPISTPISTVRKFGRK
jgi:integrase